MNQVLQCPKCHGVMRTYDRNGVHIEQCERCRGIFLDYGEMEALTRLESQWVAQPPPQSYGHGQPAWGAPHHGHHKHKSFGKMLFSS
jgi:Zn-finger nucleic acid-binding protein